jgi:hypothetical protein
MYSLLLRIVLAVGISLGASACGLNGDVNVLQTLFTVLGIVFSISMSLLVSFDLSKVLNTNARMRLRSSIEHTRICLMRDFAVSAVIFGVGVFMQSIAIVVYKRISLCVVLTAICIIAMSLLYEVYNFSQIHRLRVDLEETIIKEETSKI